VIDSCHSVGLGHGSCGSRVKTMCHRELYILIALTVELFQLIGEVVNRLLMTLLKTRLRRLMLDADQLQVLL